VQFPPKLLRLSQYRTESVYHCLQDERSFIKTLPIRVKIFNVCQEHLTGFDLILICWTTKIQALKPPSDHDHHKHWTFSLKTLNFVMRIDHYLRQFILSYKRRYWMSLPFTNRSPRFVKHGLSPRFPCPVQSSPSFTTCHISTRRIQTKLSTRKLQRVFYPYTLKTNVYFSTTFFPKRCVELHIFSKKVCKVTHYTLFRL
jgi:hypothetical protein